MRKKQSRTSSSAYSSTETELRETIAYLIEHRQAMKDVEIENLEAES